MVFDITPIGIFEELRFLFELIIGEFLFTLNCCKKRDHFYLRAILGLVVLLIASMSYFPYRSWASSLQSISSLLLPTMFVNFYIVITLLTMFYLYLCFDFTLDQAMFRTIGGYAIQHISYVIFTELMARTWFTEFFSNTFVYISLASLGFIGICILCYLIFIRKFKNNNYIYFLNQKKSYVYYLIMLIITIFLTFAGQSIYQNNSTNRIVESPNYLGAVVSILTCILILFLINMLYIDNQEKHEKDLVNQMLYEQKKQYAYKKDSTETFKKLAHDMKHQLLALKAKNADNSLVSSIEDKINEYDFLIDTKNEAINIILADKIISTKNDGIRIEFDGDANLISFMDTSDTYVFLGNALDNAIEAINRSKTNEKNISLSIKSAKGIISVVITNYFDGKTNIVNNKIQTTKEDKNIHGIGMRSMKEIVEKYNGKLSYEINNNLFTLKAVFIAK